MNGLLDTHTLMWWDSDQSRLSPVALAFLRDPNNTLIVSVATLWELCIKIQLGKLTLRGSLQDVIRDQQATGVRILDIKPAHVYALGALPAVHKNPFDRLLAAQAIAESAVLISGDPIFAHYPVT